MEKAYIYPNSAFDDAGTPNQYMEEFLDGLGRKIKFLNRDFPSARGIFDLIHYYRKIDFLFLHWIEDLPDKRGGLAQSVFFIFMLIVLKIRGSRLVWVMHNKTSHYGTNKWMKRLMFRLMLKRSDFIITHSKEGIRVLEESGFNTRHHARYFPHPLTRRELPPPTGHGFDILLWGSIIPYKGIDKFLEFLHQYGYESRYRIIIAGKVRPPEYESVVNRYCNEFIQLDNRYVPDNEIEQYMADARVVLFAYDGSSVLSSGALMDSLAYGVHIVAPNVGAFKDAGEEGLIDTYDSFEELIKMLEKESPGSEDRKEQIDAFIAEHNWIQFSGKVTNWITEKI